MSGRTEIEERDGRFGFDYASGLYGPSFETREEAVAYMRAEGYLPPVEDMTANELEKLVDEMDVVLVGFVSDLRRVAVRMVALSKPTHVTGEMVFNDLLVEAASDLMRGRVNFTEALELE